MAEDAEFERELIRERTGEGRKRRGFNSPVSSHSTTLALSSETKCNTPADLIIGTADQDLRECCHGMLFAFVG